MRGKTIRPQIIQYLESRTGLPCYADEMAKDLGVTRNQVSSGIYNLRNDIAEFNAAIQVITPGHVWRYHPIPTKTDVPLWEFVTDHAGGVLLKDEDGNLWLAKKLSLS